MASCERCWGEAYRRGIDYHEMLQIAMLENHGCTRLTPEGARLRAGQFWNEETKTDSRLPSLPEKD